MSCYSYYKIVDNGDKIYNALRLIQNLKFVEKIGISTYDLTKSIKILKKYNLDIIQFPYNIFDQRANNPKFFKVLKRNNTELHIRSILLQGLLTLDFEKLPSYFNRWKILFVNLKNTLNKKKIDIVNLSINHAFNLKYKNKKIIVGVKSLKHLKDIINTKLSNKITYVKKFNTLSKKLILPFLWKIN